MACVTSSRQKFSVVVIELSLSTLAFQNIMSMRSPLPARFVSTFVSLTLLALVAGVAISAADAQPEAPAFPVGVAQVDITPDYPVRLSGFGGRRTESEGVTLKI